MTDAQSDRDITLERISTVCIGGHYVGVEIRHVVADTKTPGGG